VVSSPEELELELEELLPAGVGVMGVAGSLSGKGKASWADFLAVGVGVADGAVGVGAEVSVGAWVEGSPGKGNFLAALGLAGAEDLAPQGLGTGAT
jgi:hypothetical protein